LKVIKEMFEASVDGQSYDAERWGQYFRPPGVNAPAGSATPEAAPAMPADSGFASTGTTVTPTATVSDFDDEEPAVAATSVEAKPPTQKAEDILAVRVVTLGLN
jgi:hypothetical protein